MKDLYLIAHVAGHVIAVESAAVESVVDLGEVTPVPLAARHVLGLATLRSRVVTVIDTAGTLTGTPAAATPRRAIVSAIDAHQYAFAVDALEDIAEFDRQPMSSGVAPKGIWARVARGVVEREGEPLLVIDLAALLPGLQMAVAD